MHHKNNEIETTQETVIAEDNHTNTTTGRKRYEKWTTTVRRRCKEITSTEAMRNVGIYARRALHSVHNASERRHMAGPMSFLGIALFVSVVTTITSLYAPSYAVVIDGQELARVGDQSKVEDLVSQVESRGSSLLGYEYHIDSEISYQFGLRLASEITDEDPIEQYLYGQLEDVGASLRKYELSVNGQVLGVMNDEEALEGILTEIQSQYVTENTVDQDFVQNVAIRAVYNDDSDSAPEEIYEVLTANTSGETTYDVVQGDTFNRVAYHNDMSATELQALNPDVDINRLSIGDTLNVKQVIPFLSVETKEQVVYSEEIPCPIVDVDDPKMYVGDSKISKKGVVGEALIEAEVSYVNGVEQSREIISNSTVREPTESIKSVGTLPRPKTASYGSYHWPVSGKITSYFGRRYIFGGYNYHSGLDIAVPYGTAVKAADGGKVTYSGWQGSYGNLVIITHDNGTQTYYGHNSSLVVSVGTKVYRGQTIAKAGSTGVSTGNHCHFEIRVGGTAVDPLSYL